MNYMNGEKQPSIEDSMDDKLTWLNDYFRPHFNEWVMGPIERLVPSRDALIGFILMACSIDYLAGFWWGESTSGKVNEAYPGFIRAYFPGDTYDPEGIYDSLRNGLVHMFTIKAKRYALTHNNRELHLKENENGQVLLNAENFADDVAAAKERYFAAVQTDEDLLNKLIDRYNRDGFLKLGEWEVGG